MWISPRRESTEGSRTLLSRTVCLDLDNSKVLELLSGLELRVGRLVGGWVVEGVELASESPEEIDSGRKGGDG